ncbi:hypothetical protein FRC03_003996 [Tulasnella sp. 419]|nr:hypothetical protein FRC03_003996 [Tulasnella sp. 419]
MIHVYRILNSDAEKCRSFNSAITLLALSHSAMSLVRIIDLEPDEEIESVTQTQIRIIRKQPPPDRLPQVKPPSPTRANFKPETSLDGASLDMPYKEPEDAQYTDWKILRHNRFTKLHHVIGPVALKQLSRDTRTQLKPLYNRKTQKPLELEPGELDQSTAQGAGSDDEMGDRDGDIICAICHGVMTDVTVLPCVHAFCKGCIAQHNHSETSTWGACPICETEYGELSKVLIHVSWLWPGPLEIRGYKKHRTVVKKLRHSLNRNRGLLSRYAEEIKQLKTEVIDKKKKPKHGKKSPSTQLSKVQKLASETEERVRRLEKQLEEEERMPMPAA